MKDDDVDALGQALTWVYGVIIAGGLVVAAIGGLVGAVKVAGLGVVLALIGFVCGVTVLAARDL